MVLRPNFLCTVRLQVSIYDAALLFGFMPQLLYLSESLARRGLLITFTLFHSLAFPLVFYSITVSIINYS